MKGLASNSVTQEDAVASDGERKTYECEIGSECIKY